MRSELHDWMSLGGLRNILEPVVDIPNVVVESLSVYFIGRSAPVLMSSCSSEFRVQLIMCVH